MRCITKSSFTAHASPLFKKLNLLKISDLSRFQSAVFMHKFSANQLPSSFNHYFTSNSSIHTYSTRQASNYHLFYANTSIRKKSIATSGPKLWKALPDNIKNASSLALFKRKLKLHLSTNYVETRILQETEIITAFYLSIVCLSNCLSVYLCLSYVLVVCRLLIVSHVFCNQKPRMLDVVLYCL